MSSEWPLVRIEDIAANQPSAMATGPFGSSISSKFFQESGIPVIRGSNLSADVQIKIDDLGLVFVSEDKAKEFPRCIVSNGDLVFTCWGTINQVGLIDDTATYQKYLISNKQMKLTVDRTKADSRFVYYVFSGPTKQSEIIENGIGSSVPGFNLGQLRKHSFRLPPLAEQQAIADVLDIFSNRISLLRETNTTLEAIAQALFKSWFVDFDPVHARARGEQPAGLAPEVAALFPDSFEETALGMVPKGWQAEPLDEIAEFLNGLALQKYPPDGDETLPVIKIAQLRKGDTVGADRASRNIKPEYIIQNGDVLFSWSGSLEVEVWCGGEGALNQHLFKVTSQRFQKWFYLRWTKIHLTNFKHIAASKATTMGHIQRKHLTEAMVVVPSSQVLAEADKIFGPLLDQWINNAEQVQTLANLRDTLLPRLISGQLRLPDAEQQLKDLAV